MNSPVVAEGVSIAARDRLAIALDVPSLDEALALAREVAPWFGVAKMGLELYSAAGPAAVGVPQRRWACASSAI